MESSNDILVYWDTSAILSVLFADSHSFEAKRWAEMTGYHLLSSFAYTETCAVVSRLKRERILGDTLVQATYERIEEGPWRRLTVHPRWEEMRELSLRWPLRGADLFHLATAKSVQEELPGLVLLTFDARLGEAAEGEGLLMTG